MEPCISPFSSNTSPPVSRTLHKGTYFGMDFPAYSDPGREDDARLTVESGLDGPRDDEGEGVTGVTVGEEREGEAVVGRAPAATVKDDADDDDAGVG